MFKSFKMVKFENFHSSPTSFKTCRDERKGLAYIVLQYTTTVPVICLHYSRFHRKKGKVGHAPSLGHDILDGYIGRLHTNFQISATHSKKVLIFSQNAQKNFLLRRC